jgi:hypothetical protein
MNWISEHKLKWRIAFLAVILVGVFGPWVFDEINVPAEYTCQPPNVRLYGDFCGIPLSGIYVVWAVLGELIRSILMLITGAFSLTVSARIILIALMGLAIILPVFSTLLVSLRPNSRRWVIFQVAACVLGAGAGLFMGLSSSLHIFYITWGVWLFLTAVIAAAVFEIILLLGYKRAHRESPG